MNESGGGSKKWIIIGLVVVLVAVIGVGGYLFVSKDKDADAASGGEIFVTAAAEPGQDPFSDASFAATPDASIAEPANGAAPAGQSATATATSGDQPGLYGGTNNLVVCDADKMANFLAANPDKAAAWVKALNDDPNLRADGGPLTVAGIPAYLSTLTPIVLVSDTRVTNHGFANGNPTRLQSILQRGTAVFVDKYGVPRVRCACGNPLAAPEAAKSTPTYKGRTWPGFSLTKVSVVQAAPSPLTSFRIAIPAKPGGSLTQLKAGPFSCVATPGNACKTPSGVVKPSPTGVPGGGTTPSSSAAPSSSAPASSSAPQTSSAPPSSSSAPQTSSAPSASASKSKDPRSSYPETTQSGTIDAVKTKRATDTYFQLKFNGYSPNSKVTFTCTDSKGTYGPFKAAMDAQGNNNDGQANCFSSDGTITVKDKVGGSFTL